MSRLKYALCTASITLTLGRRPISVVKGQVWDADDEVVRAHPDMFGDLPHEVQTSQGARPVEQASAAPGEKRTIAPRAAKRA